MVAIGFNFRASIGYVTDGAGETYVIGSDTYPTTRDSVTFGWEDSPNLTRNRNSGIDRRLSGVHIETAKLFIRFRVDLDNATDHDINAAFGEASFAGTTSAEFRDSTTVFASDTNIVHPAARWGDAAFTVRTEADWVANNTTITHTFTSTIFRTAIKEVSGGGEISHLKVKEVGAVGAVNLGLVTETDTVESLAVSRRYTLGIATETDTVEPIAVSRRYTLGIATETDTVEPIAVSRRYTLGAVTEADSVFALNVARRYTLGAVTETDSAFALTVSGAVNLGTATETDSAFALSVSRKYAASQVTETDSVFPLTVSRRYTLGPVTETDSALSLTLSRRYALSVVIETDSVGFVSTGAVLLDIDAQKVAVFSNTLVVTLDSNTAVFTLESNTPIITVE